MNPFLIGWSSARRRGADARGPEHPARISTARLVALELGWLAGRVLRPSRALPALASGAVVALLLAPVTPGPVVAGGLRVGLAAAGAVVAAMVAHAMLGRSAGRQTPGVTAGLVGVATVALLGTTSTVLAYLLSAVSDVTDVSHAAVEAGLAVDGAIAGGALLVLAGVAATRVGDRVRVPGALALLVVGMVVGSDGLGWVVVSDPQWVQGIAVAALIVILYQGGLATRPNTLAGSVAPGVLLASVGVAVTTLVVALAGTMVLGLPTQLAWLVAAVVAPTDAAAVFAALRSTPLAPRLAGVLRVESGANDPIAVLLTIAFLTAFESGGSIGTWLAFGGAQIGLGLAIGVGVGLVASVGLRRLVGHPLLSTTALAVGGVAYGGAALVGGSGFLAVYLCGITVAARTPAGRRALRSFHGALSGAVEVGLFLLLGLLVFPAGLPAVLGTGLAVAAVLLLVARPLATLVSLAPFDFRPRELAAVSWLGMRGAVPIVLATVAFSAGYEEAGRVLDIVFVVVLASILVQGVGATGVVRRLGLEPAPSPAATVADALPYEGLDGQLFDVTLGPTCRLVGRTLMSSSPPEGTLVTAIIRDDHLVVPRGSTVLRPGDHLLVAAERADAEAVVRAWATGVSRDAGAVR